MDYQYTEEFAKQLDQEDTLSSYRLRYKFPQYNNRNVVYLTGNSLGLQSVDVLQSIEQELNDWEKFGVEGHFLAKNPWVSYHEFFSDSLAKLVGAKPNEVVAMGSLTANLHFLMASFYRPTKTRHKIICEAKAFPSDQYALESQVKWHNLNPEEVIIEVSPRKGSHIIEEEDIIHAIEESGDSLAMVMIGGVNYYSGQVFDMKKITESAHKVGAIVGFDLAHAIGNVKLNLHEWNVDFAAWCSYKYLNSSPGGVAGIYVHEKHCQNKDIHRLAGWWGHDKENRFLMEKGFQPMPTAESWQLSNAPVIAMAVHKAALKDFDEIGIDKLIQKRQKLSDYLMFIIEKINGGLQDGMWLEIITPKESSRRGAQVSVIAHGMGKKLFDTLTENGIVVDWREPNVIRMATVPLYNSFEDIYRLGKALEKALKK